MQSNPTSLDSTYTSRIDTLVIYDVPPELMNTYLEILQNTNSQLSLSHNPLALAIGLLGVLFAAGAIVAGYLVFKQGRDFRKAQSEIFEEVKKETSLMTNAYKERTDSLLERIKLDADKLSQRIKSLDGNDENHEEIETLNSEINDIKNDLGKIIKPNFRSLGTALQNAMKFGAVFECENCKWGFFERQVKIDAGKWHCPRCNHLNSEDYIVL